jgi:hypothetical protein
MQLDRAGTEATDPAAACTTAGCSGGLGDGQQNAGGTAAVPHQVLHVVDPNALEYCPGPHASHDSAPGSLLKLPTGLHQNTSRDKGRQAIVADLCQKALVLKTSLVSAAGLWNSTLCRQPCMRLAGRSEAASAPCSVAAGARLADKGAGRGQQAAGDCRAVQRTTQAQQQVGRGLILKLTQARLSGKVASGTQPLPRHSLRPRLARHPELSQVAEPAPTQGPPVFGE